LENWYREQPDLPDNYIIATSATGWNNEVRAYQWFQHFDQHTKGRLLQRGDYRLLFMDNHPSHIGFDFVNYCQNHRIIPWAIPPKLTHLLQPLDGHPFQAYKHYYRRYNNRTMQWGGSVKEKADFLRQLHAIRLETFKETTVRHSFKHCGLWPFNSEVICEPLRGDDGPDLVVYDQGKEYELPEWNFDDIPDPQGPESRPATPPASSSTINSPPTTLTKLRHDISKAQKSFTALSKASATASVDTAKIARHLDYVFQGSLTQAELAAQTSADMTRILTNQERAQAPKTKRQIRTGGALSVRDANTLIRSREIAEAEKEKRKWARDAKKQRNEFLRQDQIREQENQRREAELSWEAEEDGEPLYCIDRQGMAL
jgi:hypothetical protein